MYEEIEVIAYCRAESSLSPKGTHLPSSEQFQLSVGMHLMRKLSEEASWPAVILNVK